MIERAYILIDTVEGKASEILAAVDNSPGIIAADHVEGPPDIVLVIEADDRFELAIRVNSILHSIKNITEDLHCLLANRENGQRQSY